MMGAFDIARLPGQVLTQILVETAKIRRTDKLYAMVDILRIAAVSPSVSRHQLLQGCQNIERRYNKKTIDRALHDLLRLDFLKRKGQSGMTNGGAYMLNTERLISVLQCGTPLFN